MKKLVSVICVLMLIGVCGCTQYNGYIGPIFGSWSLMEISVDGDPLELERETVFSFQNEVVRVTQVSDNPFAGENRYGNFLISDGILSLKFVLELTPEGQGYNFLVPNWLYFPKDVMPLKFEIKELKGSKMVLVLNDGTRDITYRFSKTW